MISLLLVLPFVAAKAQCALTSRDGPSCPIDTPLSCSVPSVPSGTDACCFETPGGVVLLTQFWDWSPPAGPVDEFTIHGLWPDNCDGTYEQFCNTTLQISGTTVQDIVTNQFGDQALYDYMSGHWKGLNGDEDLWTHEWNKHGTCMNTIKPECYSGSYAQYRDAYDYYRIAVALHQKLPTAKWLADAGITPDSSKTYSRDAIAAALQKGYGQKVYFGCSSGSISEIWYFHHVQGSILGETFVPIDALSSGNCPAQVKYPPKTGSTTPSSTSGGSTPTSSTSGAPQPSSSGGSTKGYIRASGSSGCLISNGKYYESGTCATFTIGSAITSSKGACGVGSDNALTCASGASASSFDTSGGNVATNGVSDWCFGAAAGSPPQTQVLLAQNGACNGKSTFKLTV